MLSLPDDWNYSVSGLVKLSKDGKDSVMAALAELEKFGYLTRMRVVNDKGQFAGVEYNIFEQPQTENPVAEKPISAKTNEEKSTAEKPPLLNTNSIKDLNNKIFMILNTNDLELVKLYQEYAEMRESIKAPVSELGIQKVIARCKRLSKGSNKLEKAILENSIRNNWKDIYLPREEELKIIQDEGLDELRSFYGLE